MRRHVHPDIVKDQELACLPPQTMARAAAALMARRHISSVLVADNGRLFGIVTTGDIARRVVGEGRNPDITPLSAIMTPNPVCVKGDDTPMAALRKMNEGRFCHLPVQRAGTIVGVVMRNDIKSDEEQCLELEDSLWEHIRRSSGLGANS